MNHSNRNARGLASRRKILDVTSRLVSRHGYDSTTISRIVKETGLPASSIYWMFKNKDELITTALEDTYSAAPAAETPGQPRWHDFRAGEDLVTQLHRELIPALHTTSSEAPIRVGIMLALEGAASDSQVQLPFRRRRASAQERIENWWRQALRELSPDAPPDRARQLGLLTMAFLDGHYVSDLVTEDEQVAQRAFLISNILWSSFRHDTSECPRCRESSPLAAAAPVERPTGEGDNTAAALLDATRQLMAQRGYEGATVTRICSRSGIRRSSLYWRYKDKDTLVKAAVAEPYLELLRPHDFLQAGSSGGIGTLTRELGSFAQRISRNPETVKAGLLLALQQWDSPESAGATVTLGTRQIEADIAAQLNTRTDLAPGAGEHLAWMFMRLREGIMLDLVLWGQGFFLNNGDCLADTLATALPRWLPQLPGDSSRVEK